MGKNIRQASEVNLTVGWKVFIPQRPVPTAVYCRQGAPGCGPVFERGDSCHYLLRLIADVCEEHSMLQSRTE